MTEQELLAKTWFYQFHLPSGAVTPSYHDGALEPVVAPVQHHPEHAGAAMQPQQRKHETQPEEDHHRDRHEDAHAR